MSDHTDQIQGFWPQQALYGRPQLLALYMNTSICHRLDFYLHMPLSWLLGLFSSKNRMAEHTRNLPLCSLLDSDGNAEASVDTAGGDPTESAAFAGGVGGHHSNRQNSRALCCCCVSAKQCGCCWPGGSCSRSCSVAYGATLGCGSRAFPVRLRNCSSLLLTSRQASLSTPTHKPSPPPSACPAA